MSEEKMEPYSSRIPELQKYKWRCHICGMLAKEQEICDHALADEIIMRNQAEWAKGVYQ
jgi:hypothetical protein